MQSLAVGFLISIAFTNVSGATDVFDKFNAPTDALIREVGFPCEEHFVTTADGYILRIFRIPSPSGSGFPILAAHGMGASSDLYVLQGPKKDLVFVLNQAGYDIWLGDFRGNAYSRNHTTLSPEENTFWNFSMHEVGIYDVPAMVDYVLHETGFSKLTYIGHSMGTTVYFICMSSRPEYNDKINLAIMMSPTVRLSEKNLSWGQRILWRTFDIVLNTFRKQNIMEVTSRRVVHMFTPLLKLFCSKKSISQDICHDLLTFWAGRAHKSIPSKIFVLIFAHYPAGSGLNVFLQYLQNAKESKFNALDRGKEKNLEVYGSENPPDYNLSLVTSPVAFYYSHNDYISVYADVKDTIGSLPNVVYESVSDVYTHADYLLSLGAEKKLYPDILRLIDSFTKTYYYSQ